MSESREPSDKAFVRSLPGEGAYAPLLMPPDSAGMRSGLVALQPGDDCGEHNTDQHEELIICLEGAGIVEAGDRRQTLSKGQVAYNPPHTLHNVLNTGTVPMRYIFVVAPAPAN